MGWISAIVISAQPPAFAAQEERFCDPMIPARLVRSTARLPLFFEPNMGQTDKRVRFLARGIGYSLFITSNETVFSLDDRVESVITGRPGSAIAPMRKHIVRMQLCGSNPMTPIVGNERLPGTVSYFIGNDPTKWRTAISGFRQALCKEVYPGIDLVYYGDRGHLEYDFRLRQGAHPSRVALCFPGARALSIDRTGDLRIRTDDGILVPWRRPVAYQQMHGKRYHVACDYRIKNGRVGFRLGRYDRRYPLVIDPILAYSTYLGGSGSDTGLGIVTDAAGNGYVTGMTSSVDFPVTAGASQPVYHGALDNGFVAKVDPTGSHLIYATYLGGNFQDAGIGIAVDHLGNAYIAGQTHSSDFPTTPGSFQPGYGGNWDVFVAKLNPTGTKLLYSTYVGGNNDEFGEHINIDHDGNAYVVGGVYVSPGNPGHFPTTPGALQPTFGGGQADAFALKLNATGSALLYSTYLGGSGYDYCYGSDLDSAGNLYMAGPTQGGAFPTTVGAFQRTSPGGQDAYAAKLNPSGSALVYATLLGSSGDDSGRDIAVDTQGNAWVTGLAAASNFPITSGAFQTTYRGGQDAFLVELNPSGSSVLYSTFLGGSQFDQGIAVQVGPDGAPYVLGMTRSNDFPKSADALQTAVKGGMDLFLVKLKANVLNTLTYGTLFGGTGDEFLYGPCLFVDSGGHPYFIGSTPSADFPTTPGALQAKLQGKGNSFIVSLNLGITDITTRVTVTRGALTADVKSHDLFQPITVTNNNPQILSGPFLLEIVGLPGGLTVSNATSTLHGNPCINISSPTLAAGGSVATRIRFNDPSRQRFHYTVRVYSGQP